MSKDQKIRIGMTVCAVVVVVAVILAVSGIFSSTGLASYANAEKYTAGPATISENVRNEIIRMKLHAVQFDSMPLTYTMAGCDTYHYITVDCVRLGLAYADVILENGMLDY